MSRARIALTLLVAAVALALTAAPASAWGSAETLRKPAPAWFTPALQAQLAQAGAEGVQVGEQLLAAECPGYKDPGVSAAACIVEPYGCTANFIFTDNTDYYIGTARHCVDGVGQPVTMQVDSATIAVVGTVAKHTGGEGEPGLDFALIKIDPAVADRWGIDPAIPVVGGPNGVYADCGPETVRYYGHGYGVAVAQGKPEGGLATNWYDDAYGWTGVGAPGDSGSPVVTTRGLGAGNFTHLVVYTALPGSNLAGMRLTAILAFAGVSLVNADGSTSPGPTSTSCGGNLEGGSGGGSGDGGGNGGGKPDNPGNGGGKPTKDDDDGGKGKGGGPPHKS